MGADEEVVDEETMDEDEEEMDKAVGGKADDQTCGLHRACWEGNMPALHALLALKPSKEQLKALDPHGNTALHIAAMRGQTCAVEALLAAGMPAGARSATRWQAMHEAMQARHKGLAQLLATSERQQLKAQVKEHRSALMDQLAQLPDFTMQLKWELVSSVPGVGLLLRRYAPHDIYTIWKQGTNLRVDGTLMGVNDGDGMMGASVGSGGLLPEWERGHFSLIYTFAQGVTKTVFVNHTKKEYTDIKALHKSMAPDQEAALQSEVDSLLLAVAASDGVIESQVVKSRDFRFDAVKGWLGRPLTEDMDGWKAKVYDASLSLVKLKRFKLPSPLPTTASWDDYLAATLPADMVLEVPTNPLTSAVSSQGRYEAKEAAHTLKEAARKEARRLTAAASGAAPTAPATAATAAKGAPAETDGAAPAAPATAAKGAPAEAGGAAALPPAAVCGVAPAASGLAAAAEGLAAAAEQPAAAAAAAASGEAVAAVGTASVQEACQEGQVAVAGAAAATFFVHDPAVRAPEASGGHEAQGLGLLGQAEAQAVASEAQGILRGTVGACQGQQGSSGSAGSCGCGPEAAMPAYGISRQSPSCSTPAAIGSMKASGSTGVGDQSPQWLVAAAGSAQSLGCEKSDMSYGNVSPQASGCPSVTSESTVAYAAKSGPLSQLPNVADSCASDQQDNSRSQAAHPDSLSVAAGAPTPGAPQPQVSGGAIPDGSQPPQATGGVLPATGPTPVQPAQGAGSSQESPPTQPGSDGCTAATALAGAGSTPPAAPLPGTDAPSAAAPVSAGAPAPVSAGPPAPVSRWSITRRSTSNTVQRVSTTGSAGAAGGSTGAAGATGTAGVTGVAGAAGAAPQPEGEDGALAADGTPAVPTFKPAKRLSGRCWMAEGFPLSLNQLLPLLEAVSAANKHISKVALFMSKYGDRQEFPVKVSLPLLFTLSISVAFKKFKLLPPAPPSAKPTQATTSTPAPAEAATTKPKKKSLWSSLMGGTSTTSTTSGTGSPAAAEAAGATAAAAAAVAAQAAGSSGTAGEAAAAGRRSRGLWGAGAGAQAAGATAGNMAAALPADFFEVPADYKLHTEDDNSPRSRF